MTALIPTNASRVEALTKKPTYKQTFTAKKRLIGVVAITIILAIPVVYGLFVSGNLTTLPHKIAHAFTHINTANPTFWVGVGVPTLLFGGSVAVMVSATQRKDRELGVKMNKIFSPSKNLEVGLLEWNKADQSIGSDMCYIDKSTLDGNGNGKAYLYNIKGCGEHYNVSFVVTFLGTPLLNLIGSVVYNAIRFCVIPFYITYRLIKQGCPNQKISENSRYKWYDIPKEMGLSLWGVIRAPFYATAYFFAGLYSFISPMGGRILGSKIERDWNGGKPMYDKGFWACTPLKEWKLEGGGDRESLHKHPYYLAGCWQPVAIANFVDGKPYAAMHVGKRNYLYTLASLRKQEEQ
ncbi:MAG: hypothetical protein K940chlam9_01819 [Chlamydiae bacterium]|nr:hypothetical protein [Chlamydiota bacterium]